MAELTPDQWARVQMLFDRAADLPDAERRSFVYEACRDETTIRREVIALLATETSVGDFLERPATTIASRWKDDPHEIDRYRVIRRIGSGGMGNVYLAERADDVYHQRVAIKVLKRGLDTDDIVRRFRLER